MSSASFFPCREIPPNEITIDIVNGEIGRGGFATVFAAQWFSHFVAIKVVALTNEGETNLKKELGLLSLLNHPGIIRVYGVTYLDGKMGIVMDRASSSLHTPSPISRRSLSHAISITSALQFLHSNNFIHRDLKPQNILMVDGRPRISDFGTSKIIAETATLKTINAMTPKYAALEAFDNNSTQESDVYSLGIILYELLTNKIAFEGINSQIALLGAKYNGTKLPFDETTPVSLQNIINNCMDNYPSNRPSINRILEVLNDLISQFEIVNKQKNRSPDDHSLSDLHPNSQENQKLAELNSQQSEIIKGQSQQLEKLNIEILNLHAIVEELYNQNEVLKRYVQRNDQQIQPSFSLIKVCLWVDVRFHDDISQTLKRGFFQNWPHLEVQIFSTDEPNSISIYNFDAFVYDNVGLPVQATLLEKIVKAGKGLVLFSCFGNNIRGDFKYGAFKGLSCCKFFDSVVGLGRYKKNDLIMKSVKSFSCVYGAHYSFITPEFQTVATLKNGDPLVLKRQFNKSRVVDFASVGYSIDSGYFGGWQSSTDGHLLIANSIVWVSGRDQH
ncbi:hypothetical protein P9112_010160 [Eukaryota sp. TZLM1-RC]